MKYIIRFQDKSALELISEKNSAYHVYLEYCIDKQIIPSRIKSWDKEFDVDESIPEITELRSKQKGIELSIPNADNMTRVTLVKRVEEIKKECQAIMQERYDSSFKEKRTMPRQAAMKL